MAKAPRPWIVMPHGPLRGVDDNLWTVDSVVPGIPGGTFPRTMTVVRLSDGAALRRHLDRLASRPGLVRIIPSHGPILETDPAGVLLRAATRIQG
jgi:hypothetical protein